MGAIGSSVTVTGNLRGCIAPTMAKLESILPTRTSQSNTQSRRERERERRASPATLAPVMNLHLALRDPALPEPPCPALPRQRSSAVRLYAHLALGGASAKRSAGSVSRRTRAPEVGSHS